MASQANQMAPYNELGPEQPIRCLLSSAASSGSVFLCAVLCYWSIGSHDHMWPTNLNWLSSLDGIYLVELPCGAPYLLKMLLGQLSVETDFWVINDETKDFRLYCQTLYMEELCVNFETSVLIGWFGSHDQIGQSKVSILRCLHYYA